MRVVLASLLIAPTMLVAQSAPSFATGKLLRGARVLPLEQNGEPLEIAAFGGIRVVDNGGVLFADTKPVTVRVWSGARGTVRQTSRAGAGPGEFRVAPEFVGYRGRFDCRFRRRAASMAGAVACWRIRAGAGNRCRCCQPDHGSRVGGGRRSGFQCIHRSTACPVDPGPVVSREVTDARTRSWHPVVVRQARSGDLWTAPAIASTTWQVFDAAGTPLHSAVFGSPFRLQFVNDTMAIGQSTDQDGLPQIVGLSLRGAGGTHKRGNLPSTPSTAGQASERTTLTALLQRLVMKQEMAYADSASYTTSIDRLRVDVPNGVRLAILEATNRGWLAMAFHEATRTTCVMGVGARMVIGWNEAAPYCSP